MKTNFLGGAYKSSSLPLACQTAINLILEPAPPGSAERGMLFSRPGKLIFATLGSGPHRGAHTAFGYSWEVSGGDLYRLDSSGVVTPVGPVPGLGRVTIKSNDTQVVVMHSAGWHVYTPSDGSYGAVPNAPTTAQGAFQDSYIVFPNENGTYGWSDIGNAQSLDALNFASAEAQPDKIVAVISDHRELWLLGETTTEVAQTSGDADLVFVRTAIMEHGCASKYSPAKSDNTVFWLGRDENGRGVVFRADGYVPSRVSTHALEAEIETYGDVSDAWGYCYQVRGHTHYVLTFPGQATWAYDASTREWYRYAYRNPFTGVLEQDRAGSYCYLKGMHLVGDYVNGLVYSLSFDVHTDNGDEIYCERTFGAIEAEGRFIRHHRLEVMGEKGVGLDGSPLIGADPMVNLQWSDDGGSTWSNIHPVPVGKIGERKRRSINRRMGLSRNRVYKIWSTDPVKRVWYGVNLDAEVLSR